MRELAGISAKLSPKRQSPKWRVLRATIVVCVAGISISSVVLAQNISRLDALLQSADTPELVRELRSAPRMSAKLEAWLRKRAEEGHAVPQYELGMRIGKSNIDETLKWSARARMARILDASECASSDYPVRLGWVLDEAYKDLDGIARNDESRFHSAVNDALAWEASSKSKTDPQWICGKRNPSGADSFMPDIRQDNRKRAREFLVLRARDMAQRQQLLGQLESSPNFETRDVPLIGYPLKWLDDQRLYIVVDSSGAARERMKSLVPNSRYVIWNFDTNTVEPARTIPDQDFCYQRGFVSYMNFKDGTRYFFEGPWGEEKEVMQLRFYKEGIHLPDDQRIYVEPSGKIWSHPTSFYINRFSCRMTRWQHLDEQFLKLKWPLGEGDGYIVVEQSGNKLTYYPDAGVSPVPLPWRFSDVHTGVYSPALHAYFFPLNLSSRSSKSPLEVWILEPNGQLRSEIVPAGPWFSASKGILATRVGIALWSHNRSSTGDGFAGVYLSRNGRMTRLLQGFPTNTQVSPDGCRIAAALERPGGTKQLRVVDVCNVRS